MDIATLCKLNDSTLICSGKNDVVIDSYLRVREGLSLKYEHYFSRTTNGWVYYKIVRGPNPPKCLSGDKLVGVPAFRKDARVSCQSAEELGAHPEVQKFATAIECIRSGMRWHQLEIEEEIQHG